MSAHPDVLVIGAGVIGLTTAVTLAEAGYRVRVFTAEAPGQTTSATAGALWGPWLVEPRERVLPWATTTLDLHRKLAAAPDSGVRIASGIEISNASHGPPDWAHLLPDRRPLPPHELPPGYAHGYRYTAPLIDMPTHLAHLANRLTRAGGTLHHHRIESIEQATHLADHVVNCSGVGARELAHDTSLYPVRGHHLILTNPGLTDFIEADTGDSPDLTAIYPHPHHVILGGTAQPDEWDRITDPATAQAILARCSTLQPQLAHAHVLDQRVGLRPTRPTIRLEPELHPNGALVIHNYGHAGAGVSLSWGCAHEVENLLATGSPGITPSRG
jgi:D-amino-acid oxidase